MTSKCLPPSNVEIKIENDSAAAELNAGTKGPAVPLETAQTILDNVAYIMPGL